MTVSASIKKLLDGHHIPYRVFNHRRTLTLEQAVELVNIPKSKVLKVQLLSDGLGNVLAVTPLGRRIDFIKLKKQLHRNLRVLPDFKVNRIFGDCESGSHPPFGEPYGLQVLIDKSIEKIDFLYFEAGSHTSMVQMAVEDYLYLNLGAVRLSFVSAERSFRKVQLDKKTELIQEHEKMLANCSFPNLPSIARQLLNLSFDKQHSVQKLIDLVANDEEIHNQILNYTKLPFLSPSVNQEVETLHDVVTHSLGFDRVSHIALGVAAGRAFNLQKNKALDLHDFWQHAFCCAILSEKITELVPDSFALDPAISYISGLFHNFGFLLFSELFPPEFRLLNKWRKLNPKISIHVLEKRLLGMGRALDVVRGGHAQLGAWLLRYWDMPEHVCLIAKEHHTINYEGRYKEYVRIIQLSNQILRTYNIGDGQLGGVEPEVYQSLGLDQQVVESSAKIIMHSVQGIQDLTHSLTN